MQHFMFFQNFASSISMGPTIVPLELFICKSTEIWEIKALIPSLTRPNRIIFLWPYVIDFTFQGSDLDHVVIAIAIITYLRKTIRARVLRNTVAHVCASKAISTHRPLTWNLKYGNRLHFKWYYIGSLSTINFFYKVLKWKSKSLRS